VNPSDHSSPRLAVVICSYDGAGRLGRTLAALAAQTVPAADLEVIVVDDASDDGTADVARAHGATVLRHETNQGAPAARNTGLHAASAPIVAFLDDDCAPGPRWAELLLAAYAENADTATAAQENPSATAGDRQPADENEVRGIAGDRAAGEVAEVAHAAGAVRASGAGAKGVTGVAGVAGGGRVAGVGGPIVPADGRGYVAGFLKRENRHEPLELELTVSTGLPYRLWLYLRRQWAAAGDASRDRRDPRDVHAFSGGNMSYERERLLAVGGFDARFRHASEEEDLARRLRADRPGRLVFVPGAEVTHHCAHNVRGLLRRSLAYGRGAAMQHLKWPSVRPTVFPWPFLVALLLLLATLWPPAALAAAALPPLLYPAGLRHALTRRRLAALADPYLRLAQETCENIGFVHGWWAFRDMFPAARSDRTESHEFHAFHELGTPRGEPPARRPTRPSTRRRRRRARSGTPAPDRDATAPESTPEPPRRISDDRDHSPSDAERNAFAEPGPPHTPPARPQAAESATFAPRTTGPQATAPRATGPEPTGPLAPGPRASGPQATGPRTVGDQTSGFPGSSPRTTGPRTAGPRASGSRTTGRRASGRQATGPQSAGTQAIGSQVGGSSPVGSASARSASAEPEFGGPQSGGSEDVASESRPSAWLPRRTPVQERVWPPPRRGDAASRDERGPGVGEGTDAGTAFVEPASVESAGRVRGPGEADAWEDAAESALGAPVGRVRALRVADAEEGGLAAGAAPGGAVDLVPGPGEGADLEPGVAVGPAVWARLGAPYRWMVVCGAALVLIAGLAQLRDLWAARLVLVPLLLVVPGCLLLRALRVPGARVVAFPLYVPAASLVVLMVSGLVADLVVPLLGPALGPVLGAGFDPQAPLRPGPTLAVLELCCVGLFLAGVPAPAETAIPWRWPAPAAWLSPVLLLPPLAAAGALRLTHERGAAVAMVALAGCALALIFGVVRARHIGAGRLAVLLYAVSLAMMWSYALRGDLVYGYDIAAEYAVAQETATSGLWVTGPHPDAYGAMLSITVLPTQLHALTGLPVVLVLKLVYPAVFALFPVGIFHLAARFLPRHWAFAAAAFVVAQGALTQQLPALARQEVALLLFAALCGALLDAGLARWSKVALLGLFGPAIVVSHYTTAYFTIAMLGGALTVWAVLLVARRGGPAPWPVAAGLLPAVLAGALWYVPITQSANNVGEFRAALSADGLRLLPGIEATGGLISGFLRGTDVIRIPTYRYAKEVVPKYRPPKLAVTPAADADDPKWALGDAKTPAPPRVLPLVSALLAVGVLLIQQLANLLALAGALIMALHRRTTAPVRQVGLLALPMLGLLVLLRLSATFAAAYNQSRAQVQALTIVSVALFWLLHRATRGGALDPGRHVQVTPARPPRSLPHRVLSWPRRRSYVLAAAAVMLVFASGSGFDTLALGGERAANIAAEGEDCERFCMYSPEPAGASWLGRASAGSPDRVYADRYAQLRLFAALGPGQTLQTDITPQTLDRHAWIYASRTNIVHRRARSLFDDKLALYAFPTRFVEAHYDLVYTSGVTKVFHR
jgi:GT2 family glycosyltransferase